MYNEICLGCQRYAKCRTTNTEYEGKTHSLTLCQWCWQCWYEFVMVNGNRYRKVEKVSFIKKHQKSLVRDTIKHILAEVESRRLMALQEKQDSEVEIVDSSEIEPDEDTLYAEYLYRRMNGSKD